jgi:hypothetical protein
LAKRANPRPAPLPKRNLAAKLSPAQPGAGPMKDKSRKSRQRQRVEDAERLRADLPDE